MARDGDARSVSEHKGGEGGSHEVRTTLAARILRETARFAALQTFATILAWAANLLLARLLSRRDFGVYAICSVWVGVGSVLGDGGLGAALLRRKEEPTQRELQTALTTLLVISSTMAVALFALAPWLAARAHLTPSEGTVMRALAPMFLVGALRVVPYVKLERALSFSRIARIELIASTVRHAGAIALAFVGMGPWALVAANLASSALQLTLAYRAAPGWPGLGLDLPALRALFSYGGRVQALAICAYIKDNISGALLGNVLGPVSVGVFDFGLKYIQIPVLAVNSLARVQLPVYARLQARDPILHASVLGALRSATVLGVPLLVGLSFGAPWIIPKLYDPKWAPSYPVVWGFLVNMIGGLCASPLFTLLQGQGRPGLAIWVFGGWTLTTWGLAIAAVVLRPGDLGLVAGAHSAVTMLVVLALLRWAATHMGGSLTRHLLAPWIAGLCALIAGFSLVRVGGWAAHPLVCGVASMLAYALVLLLLERGRVVREVRAITKGARGDAVTAAGTGTPPPTSEPGA